MVSQYQSKRTTLMENIIFLLLIVYSALVIRVLFTQIEVSYRIHRQTKVPIFSLIKFCIYYSAGWPIIFSKDPLGFLKIYLLGQRVLLSMVHLNNGKEQEIRRED